MPTELPSVVSCPPGGERRLTDGEIALARSIFGHAIAYERVTIRRRKFFPFQPRKITKAPRGHLQFHPLGDAYSDDISTEPAFRQGLYIHEKTHVWQSQSRGAWFLLLHRRPFSRYSYGLTPGWPLERYGIEQQAEIVRHAFLLRRGVKLAGIADSAAYDLLVDFPGAG
jgi:hypothetical protein